MYRKFSRSSVLVVLFLLLAIGLLAACEAESTEVEVTRIVEVPVTVIAEAPEPVAEEVVQEEGPSGQLKISET